LEDHVLLFALNAGERSGFGMRMRRRFGVSFVLALGGKGRLGTFHFVRRHFRLARKFGSANIFPTGQNSGLNGPASRAKCTKRCTIDGSEGDVSNSNAVVPNDLSAFWMPFTANRQFKKSPRM